MSYAIETLEHNGRTIEIYHDEDCEGPRDWDNLGRMVCWHKSYILGDATRKHPRASAEDGTEFPDPDDFQAWWKEHGKGGEILPLYLYDHSGITMSCAPFACPWDSGQVGYIYVTRERMLREYGGKRLTKAKRENALRCLRAEVETYDEYLTGNVFYFVVTDQETGEVLDSCGGMYGFDYCIEEAKRAAGCYPPVTPTAEILD